MGLVTVQPAALVERIVAASLMASSVRNRSTDRALPREG